MVVDMTLFPLLVKLEARKCLVVGGGKIASGKAAGLLRHGAEVIVVSPKATKWVRLKAGCRKLAWRRRTFTAADLKGMFLAVAATSSATTNQAVFRACRARGVLCNVVDDPEHCDFFYPAVVRRGPLQIAISTDGNSPALAGRLRREMERQFGPEWGDWIKHVGRQRREILRRAMAPEERRKQLLRIANERSFQEFVAQSASPNTRTTRPKSASRRRNRGPAKP
jgi:siroheme synthase-like protein